MALIKCEICGNVFNSIGSKVCVSCADEADKSYAKVKKYLYQNPDKKSFAAIIEATEISEKILSYLIDHGRIIVDAGSGKGIRCRACGTVTGGEPLCEKCRSKLISEKLLTGLYANEKKKSSELIAVKKNNIVMLKRGKENED